MSDVIPHNDDTIDQQPSEAITVAGPATPPSVITAFRSAVAAMDDRRAELAEAGDKENLAVGAADVAMLADELLIVKKQAAADIARIVNAEGGPRKFEVPNLGVVEVHGGVQRKNWKSTEVLTEVILRAIADPETGEWLNPDASPIEIAAAIEANIQTTIGMTGSTAWKVGRWDEKSETWKGGLRSLDIDPDDYCDEVVKPDEARIPKWKLGDRGVGQ